MKQHKRRKNLSKVALGEVSIVYRRPPIKTPVKVNSSDEAYLVFQHIFESEKLDYKEFFFVLLLSYSKRCIWYSKISEGSVAGTVVNVREVLQLALKTNASGVIIAHNHPSGNLKPSESDIKLTRKIKDGCGLFDVQLLDHLIITSEGYLSIADEGLI